MLVKCLYYKINRDSWDVGGYRFIFFNIPEEIRQYSSNSKQADDQKKIASYEELKDLHNHKEKLLIDVREPNELIETGIIPTSINIPRKFFSSSFNKSLLSTSSVNLVAKMLAVDFPKDQFLKLFNRKKPSQETSLIFFCMIGKRLENASIISRQLGYKK